MCYALRYESGILEGEITMEGRHFWWDADSFAGNINLKHV